MVINQNVSHDQEINSMQITKLLLNIPKFSTVAYEEKNVTVQKFHTTHPKWLSGLRVQGKVQNNKCFCFEASGPRICLPLGVLTNKKDSNIYENTKPTNTKPTYPKSQMQHCW